MQTAFVSFINSNLCLPTLPGSLSQNGCLLKSWLHEIQTLLGFIIIIATFGTVPRIGIHGQLMYRKTCGSDTLLDHQMQIRELTPYTSACALNNSRHGQVPSGGLKYGELGKMNHLNIAYHNYERCVH